LGLISLQQYDPVRLATPVIEALALQLGHTVAIAVWGTRGPTIVRVAGGPTPVHISMRHGTVMSLAGTASGRLFAAWPADEAAALGESPARRRHPIGRAPRWLATSRDSVVAGVSAAATPVFEASGRLVMALTAIGPSASFDTAPESSLVRPLREAWRAVSPAGPLTARPTGWRKLVFRKPAQTAFSNSNNRFGVRRQNDHKCRIHWLARSFMT
jgi:DNA-binding IclR family transcriptional regulator